MSVWLIAVTQNIFSSAVHHLQRLKREAATRATLPCHVPCWNGTSAPADKQGWFGIHTLDSTEEGKGAWILALWRDLGYLQTRSWETVLFFLFCKSSSCGAECPEPAAVRACEGEGGRGTRSCLWNSLSQLQLDYTSSYGAQGVTVPAVGAAQQLKSSRSRCACVPWTLLEASLLCLVLFDSAKGAVSKANTTVVILMGKISYGKSWALERDEI